MKPTRKSVPPEKPGGSTCQVTIDGLGKKNDVTRRLAGGGPTFERITDNLKKNIKDKVAHIVQGSYLQERG